ncbi:MAG: GNAT family N-acetyltransferase [Phenylobacterium sp.]|jgi:RimJ/RimL family protein N-acetyltransferase|uniref:GNAT family N-acetyltransferase n=1 Tax=Phenylobacterium sp. TaxID=1871053 RepID=UPI002A36FC5C|nr:GNAT family N-acetyltransferase [Phenylobacterium sp.]MDX9999168.1 GNAT family N-acetyltransferase [Phenylobacterium sp.]
MSSPPKTRLSIDPSEAEDIRRRVRNASAESLGPASALAPLEHAEGLVDLLSDPAVSGPLYALPRPIDLAHISAWIEQALEERSRGEGLLFVTLSENAEVVGYSKFTIWPQWAAGEIAGARRADKQNSGQGRTGAARSFGWMFEELGLRLIGVTAALDNVRSAKVIEAAGFRYMGERDSVRPDGGVRRSRYWELRREDWLALNSAHGRPG